MLRLFRRRESKAPETSEVSAAAFCLPGTSGAIAVVADVAVAVAVAVVAGAPPPPPSCFSPLSLPFLACAEAAAASSASRIQGALSPGSKGKSSAGCREETERALPMSRVVVVVVVAVEVEVETAEAFSEEELESARASSASPASAATSSSHLKEEEDEEEEKLSSSSSSSSCPPPPPPPPSSNDATAASAASSNLPAASAARALSRAETGTNAHALRIPLTRAKEQPAEEGEELEEGEREELEGELGEAARSLWPLAGVEPPGHLSSPRRAPETASWTSTPAVQAAPTARPPAT